MAIEQYEVAARHYCFLKGLDPDELIPYSYSDPNGFAVVLRKRSRWMNVAEKVEEYDMMFQACMHQAEIEYNNLREESK